MPSVQLTPLPNGPYRIEGDLELVDSEGRSIAAPQTPIHLCRCGGSANKPFCDGTHARSAWKDDA